MLYFMIGLPRCGKSTYVDKWVMEKPNRVVVCSDDIRMALHGKAYESLSETMVFAIKHVVIRAHLLRGCEVMVDGTHTTETSMRRILEIDSQAKPILVKTSKETCISRAIATNQEYLIPVINRQSKNLQALETEGLYNRIRRINEEIANKNDTNRP